MAAELDTTKTFANGDLVDATTLNNIIDQANALEGIISNRGTLVAAVPTDQVMILRPGTPNTLKRSLVSTLPGSGTVTNFTAQTLPGVFTTGVDTGATTPNLRFIMASTGNNKFLASPADGSNGALTVRAITAGDISTAATIGASLIDLTQGTVFSKTLTALPNTFTLSGGVAGQVIKVWVQQTVAGTATLAWAASGGGTVRWPSGTPPVLTTGASRIDIFEFLCKGANSYYGIRWGKDMQL